MANPRTTHTGTRRSEKHDKAPAAYKPREGEDPDLPGMHSVIVPKTNPMGASYASPIHAYEGDGYEITSEEATVTGNADYVKMSITYDDYLERMAEQATESSQGTAASIQDAKEKMILANQGRGDLNFIAERSGGQEGAPQNLETLSAALPSGPATPQGATDKASPSTTPDVDGE